jgi:hypothetical protein
MTALRDLPAGDEAAQRPLDLVDEKAWELLGITGQEFRRRWWAGQYRDDDRPETRALDALMRTGSWGPQE